MKKKNETNECNERNRHEANSLQTPRDVVNSLPFVVVIALVKEPLSVDPHCQVYIEVGSFRSTADKSLPPHSRHKQYSLMHFKWRELNSGKEPLTPFPQWFFHVGFNLTIFFRVFTWDMRPRGEGSYRGMKISKFYFCWQATIDKVKNQLSMWTCLWKFKFGFSTSKNLLIWIDEDRKRFLKA